MEGSSSNVHVKKATCYSSGGMSVGSVGPHIDQPEHVQNVVFENFRLYDSPNGVQIKTYPGTGQVRNITFRNTQFENVNQPIHVSSCISKLSPVQVCKAVRAGKDFPDSHDDCENSRPGTSDVTWEDITGEPL